MFVKIGSADRMQLKKLRIGIRNYNLAAAIFTLFAIENYSPVSTHPSHSFGPQFRFMRLAMASITCLALTMKLPEKIRNIKLGTKDVAIDARPNTSVEGTRTASRPYRPEMPPRIGAMIASGRL